MENNIKKNKRFYLIVVLLSAAMAILQYLIYSFNDVLSYFYMGNTIYYMRFLVFPFAIWAIYRFVKYKKIDSVLSILVMFGFCFSLDRYYNYIRRFDGDAS